MTTLREAAERALENICGARLCEVNSMSSRQEALRLLDKAAGALRAALAEPDEVAAEREAIWNFIFEYAGRDDLSDSDQSLLKYIADAIRARGNDEP